mmetsp:Transcript_89352/g.251601  ORF Transcript_89352/g.251601 Transcript_89352/m.251601 type:complete len:216 (-) Transcript_89352:219-866(-)
MGDPLMKFRLLHLLKEELVLAPRLTELLLQARLPHLLIVNVAFLELVPLELGQVADVPHVVSVEVVPLLTTDRGSVQRHGHSLRDAPIRELDPALAVSELAVASSLLAPLFVDLVLGRQVNTADLAELLHHMSELLGLHARRHAGEVHDTPHVLLLLRDDLRGAVRPVNVARNLTGNLARVSASLLRQFPALRFALCGERIRSRRGRRPRRDDAF